MQKRCVFWHVYRRSNDRNSEQRRWYCFFSLPVKDHKKRESVSFIESKAPEVVKEKAENMVVVLPVYGQNDQELSSIHLYPKNEENNYPDPPFEKVLEESRDDFTIGDKITYSLHTTIPMNILDYQKFVLSDSADGALTFYLIV